MKLITAITRPEKLGELIDTVIDHKAPGLTVTEVRGFGQQFGKLPVGTVSTAMGLDPWQDAKAALLPKVRLDILIQDEDAEVMVDAIARCARTGEIGDGKIWVCDVDNAMRVRTAEQGHDAV